MARQQKDTVRIADTLRAPPHSVEAEQAVLGGLMLDTSAWDAVADVLTAADFYRPDHRLIFEACAAVVEQNKPIDVVTLSEQLERTGQLEQAGGIAYLGVLARDTPSAANIRAYADIVRERALLRRLITVGNEVAGSAFNPEGRSARELVDEAERRVFEIAEAGSRGRGGLIRVSSILSNVVDRIDQLYRDPNALRGVPTGFTQLDQMTGGLQKGDLVIVAGRPSMGKTSLCLNMAENAALGHGIASAVFSMEMSAEQLTLRMISSLGRIDQSSLRTGRLNEEDWPRIDTAMTQLSQAPIFIDETPALTPTELRARARRLKREHNIGLIVVDYLQLMQVPGTKENRATEISEISRSLKALAKELNLPVLALSQLNRSVEQRTDKKPVMSDLRECVTGETLVCLADGRRVPIRDLVGSTPEVWAVDEHQKLVRAKADKVWRVGRKPVFRMRLASGRSLCATEKHRVLAGAGWKTVGELKPGDRVALSRRLPQPENVDTLPAEVFSEVRSLMRAAGISQREMTRMRGTAYGGSSHFSFAPSRHVLSEYAALLNSDHLRTWAESDLFWDRIVAIEPQGEQEVFDLTVPGPASWLADGIVSHNSGAIEQDADLIMLIYREDVYEPDTPRKGIADIIIAKQRNGPTGEVQLTFLGQYTRFENYAPESYGEGVF